MKKICFIVTCSILLCGIGSFAQKAPLAAFPGAEGFGALTPGGRGGKVYVVTSLADSGAGTLREACSAKGPRTVVFNVSGIIELKTPLEITNPYITIAGQTAPGDGICLKRRELKISTHNVIVRYIRSRPGDIEGAEMDAISVVNGGHDVILDHCSANWSIDEGLSPSGNIYNITVQWCLIGQALLHSVHKKGAHGFGSLVRGTGGITLHHNLWIDNVARNPRLGDNYNKPPWPTIDVRNNVMYNWGQMASGMTGGNISVNYVSNYLKPGPSSSDRRPIVLTKTSKVKFYLKDNIVEGRPHHTAIADSMFEDGGDRALYQVVDKPFDVPAINMSPAQKAYTDVLATVGASKPVRDSVDARLVREVLTNTGKMIDSQNDVGGWPVYRTVKPYKDTDGDGIPDSWETANKMDPENPADAMKKDSLGYTGIENYMNELTR
jgi:pectate lyase